MGISKTTAHPFSRRMSAAEGNRLLAAVGFGPNTIGEALAEGADARRGKIDMLRHRWLGYSPREACGARREWRVSADWHDSKESHEATATLAYKWDGATRWEPVK